MNEVHDELYGLVESLSHTPLIYIIDCLFNSGSKSGIFRENIIISISLSLGTLIFFQTGSVFMPVKERLCIPGTGMLILDFLSGIEC